jgi:hypothetical protein
VLFFRQGINFLLFRLLAFRWKNRVQASASLSQIIRDACQRRARSTATRPKTHSLRSCRSKISSKDSWRLSCATSSLCMISFAMCSSALAFPNSFLLHCRSLIGVRWSLKNNTFMGDIPGTASFQASYTTSLKRGMRGQKFSKRKVLWTEGLSCWHKSR